MNKNKKIPGFYLDEDHNEIIDQKTTRKKYNRKKANILGERYKQLLKEISEQMREISNKL